MAHIFPRRSVVAGAKRIIHVRDAVNVVEQLAYDCPPGGGMGPGVMRVNLETAGKAMRDAKRSSIVTRAVIGAENRNVGGSARQRTVGHEHRIIGHVFITPVLMHSLVMFVVEIQPPGFAQGVLDTRAGLQVIGRVVMRVDDRPLITRH